MRNQTLPPFRKASFRQQLTVAFVGGIFCLSLLSAWAISTLSYRIVRQRWVSQGLRVTETLAAQATLALLYLSAENAEAPVRSILAFPDVGGVAIHGVDHALLLSKGEPVPEQLTWPQGLTMERETDRAWYFVAPVFARRGPGEEASPFAAKPQPRELIGFVRLVMRKDTLNAMEASILRINFAVSGGFAVLFLLVLLAMTRRLISPLNSLSKIMAQAAAGEKKLRAEISGPKDIVDMELAFNTMMRVLESREQQLEAARDAALDAARSNALSSFALNHVREAASLVAEDGRFLYVNDECRRLLGYSAEEQLAMTLLDISPGWTAEGWRQHWREIRDTGSVTVEERLRRKDEVVIPVEVSANYFEYQETAYNLCLMRDISERKQMEAERLANLKFLQCMDMVNRTIQAATDLDQMMGDLLDIAMSIFACDRAFFMYPCDPAAATWRVPMERNRPEYPGVQAPGRELPMDEAVARTLCALLANDRPVQFGPDTTHALPDDMAQHFAFRSCMAIAIYPKVGKPWQFGIHQCSSARVWTADEERLLHEIGRRAADGLTGLLSHRDLQASEARYRLVFENSPVSIWEEDFSRVKTLLDGLRQEGVTDIETYFDHHPETVRQCAELARVVDVNRAALELHQAATKDELLAGLVDTFTPESFATFRQELVCLWHGGTEMTSDAVVKTLAGEPRAVTVYFTVCPEYEKSFSKILVSLVDINERMQAEEALRALNEELEQRVKERTGELAHKNLELERFNKLFVGRELKMIELKERLTKLERRHPSPPGPLPADNT